MARATTKRKSEGALATGRSKQRKTSDSSEESDESSDAVFIQEPVPLKHVKKSVPKSRKTEPVPRVKKVDEKRKIVAARREESESSQSEDQSSDFPEPPVAPGLVKNMAPKPRKSEPLPGFTKTAAAHRKDSKSSQDGDESSNASEQPVAPKHVKKSAPKSRKSEPVMRATKADEYAEDEGRIESQDFLALVEATSKKKAQAAKEKDEFMGNFTDSIDSEEQALKKRLQKLNAASSKLDTTFLETFTNAYAASRPASMPTSEVARGKIRASEVSFAALYERSKEITANALNLVEVFEEANEKTTKIEIGSSMISNWEEQNDTAEKVIAVGRIVGLQKFEALTAGESVPDVDEDMAVFAGAFYMPEDEITDGWGTVARKQQKAYKKLDKTFAREVVV